MSAVVLRAAASDPRIQQIVLEAAAELGIMTVNAIKGRRSRNRKKKATKEAESSKMVLYKQPTSRAPVSLNTVAKTRRPRLRGTTTGGFLVQHREYIGEVVGSTTFGVQSYQIQPGLPNTFPWLSGIANNFEKYRIKSLVLEYVNVSATSERGRITLAYDADPLDEDPVGKVELFGYKGAKEGAVWAPLRLPIPVESKTYFTRNSLVAGTDLKTYDAGKILVGSSNTASAVTIGELFLSYEIELTIPQPTTCPSATITGGSGLGLLSLFGTDPTIVGSMPIVLGGSHIQFDAPGFYAFSMRVGGTTPGLIQASIASGDGALSSQTTVTNGGNYSSISLEIWCKTPGLIVDFVAAGTSVNATFSTLTTSSNARF